MKLFKNAVLLYSFVLAGMLLLPLVAFADDPTIPLDPGAFWSQLITVLSGLKGASVIGIAVLISQLVLTFFRTPLGDFAGVWKLIIVTGVSVITMVLGNLQSGMSFLAALFAGGTVAAIQVFVNEIIHHTKMAVNPALPSEAKK